MRILLINQYYWPSTSPTAQILHALCEHLADRGHEVHVITSRGGYHGVVEDTEEPYCTGKVRVHRLAASTRGRGSHLGRIQDYASFYLLALKKALLLRRADVCVTMTTPPFIGWVGAMLRSLRRTRMILWSMDLYPEVLEGFGVMRRESLAYRVLAVLARGLYRRCDRIVSLGAYMDGRLIEAGADPRSVVSVQNWALTEPASPAFVTRDTAATLDDHQRQTVFMYAGNLGLGHDLETFVKALGELGASQARLEVVGGGRGREPMQRTAAAHAPGAVRFRPPVDRERLRETLADADVYLVSQRPGTEGMIVPSKVYTSMAMGRPILFCGPARCEVASLVTAAQAGFVVETGDVAAAASAMRRLSGDAALRARLGRNARLYYHRHLGKDRSLAAITSLIEQTPAPRAAAPPPMTDLADRRRQVHRRRRQIRAALQGGARRNRPRRLHRSR